MLKISFELFSWTKRAIDSNFIGSIEVTCRSKVAKIILIENPRWPPSWKSILNFFSWTERPVDSNLSGNHVSDTGPSWPSYFYVAHYAFFYFITQVCQSRIIDGQFTKGCAPVWSCDQECRQSDGPCYCCYGKHCNEPEFGMLLKYLIRTDNFFFFF